MLRRSLASVLLPRGYHGVITTGISNQLVLADARSSIFNGSVIGQRTYYDDETNKNDDGSSTRKNLSDHERALYDIAKPRLEEYRSKHVRMPDLNKIPPASLVSTADGSSSNTTLSDSSNSDDIALMIRRKRLIYRCMQRGWLEVDLLLGTWASQNVMSLTVDELNEFEEFVNSETIDIYNIITLRLDSLPEQWKKNSNTTGIVERIQEWAKSNPLGRADPEKYKEIKASAKLI
jgi:succinate dehydrogenase assembly factor 2